MINILKNRKMLNITFLLLLSIFLFSYVSAASGYAVETSLSQYSYISLAFLAIYITYLQLIKHKSNISNLKVKVNAHLVFLFFTVFTLMFISIIFYPDGFRFLFVLIIWNFLFFYVFFLLYIQMESSIQNYLMFVSTIIFVLGIISLIMAFFLKISGNINFGPIMLYQAPEFPRLYGWYGNPNRFGSVMAVSLLSGLYVRKRVKNKKIFNVIILGLTIGLLLSGSKGAILSLTIALILNTRIPLVKEQRILKKNFGSFLKLALTFPIVGLIVIRLLPENFSEQIIRLGNFDNSRFDIWGNLYDIIYNNNLFQTLFGNGYGFFQSYVGLSPHNSFIRWVSDFGLIFLVMMIIIFIVCLTSILFKDELEFTLLRRIYIYIIVHQMFTQSIFQVRLEGMLFIAILIPLLFGEKSIESLKKGLII
ncbi:hypothetical protein [Amphibacillus sediminis]|uniref:hypothetical protein n=1 Tax=Amphibacillus sediminis TaxID=360185 RepID=UPI000836ACED|nr:hypothetical protein [Amphibacillus sediminis]